jgi:hypothetical protein
MEVKISKLADVLAEAKIVKTTMSPSTLSVEGGIDVVPEDEFIFIERSAE